MYRYGIVPEPEDDRLPRHSHSRLKEIQILTYCRYKLVSLRQNPGWLGARVQG